MTQLKSFPFIIADVGANWCRGNTDEAKLTLAKRHIYDAALCGVNAVKFQLFTDKELYGLEGGINRYALPRHWIPELAAYAADQGVEFMCSAFSLDGYKYLDGFVNIHKVASAEMKHPEILKFLAGTGKPFIVSTGGAHFEEVDWLMQYLWECKAEMSQLVLLECAPSYPAQADEYNLNMLKRSYSAKRTVKKTDGTEVETEWMGRPVLGVSDHTSCGNQVALAAVGLGATVFEVHFDALAHFTVKQSTPDTKASVCVGGLCDFVYDLRTAFEALGDGIKRGGRQRDFTLRHRRRLKVTAPIKKGEALRYGQNYGIYRSLTEDPQAAAPEHYLRFEGKVASRDLEPGAPVWIDSVESL